MTAVSEKKSEQRPAPGAAVRILAIDYGRKRIGLALSDELGLTAQPLTVLKRKNRAQDLNRLRDICARNSVGLIIVGLPLHITGEESEMAEEAASFAERLSKAVRIESEMVDERLTSWEARASVSEAGGRRNRDRDSIDDVAAAILLRDYLAHRRENAAAAERD